MSENTPSTAILTFEELLENIKQYESKLGEVSMEDVLERLLFVSPQNLQKYREREAKHTSLRSPEMYEKLMKYCKHRDIDPEDFFTRKLYADK